jgi:hypothetical protein
MGLGGVGWGFGGGIWEQVWDKGRRGEEWLGLEGRGNMQQAKRQGLLRREEGC